MLSETVRQKLIEAEAGYDDAVVVHVLEQPMVQAATAATITATVTTVEDMDLSRVDEDDLVITSTRPISLFEAGLEREQLAGWLIESKAVSDSVKAEGLLLGYDPLNPERTFQPGDVAIDETGVSLSGEPLFGWNEVARASACRGSHTASYFLVDGRSVHLHADIDWFNALS